jgi:CubicO group peptidase (beta-lactamase class C family)
VKAAPGRPALQTALDDADAIVAGAVGEAFPGAVLAVGLDGRLVHLKPFGRLSYAADAPEVRADTVYDLASLTKVVVTATLAMGLLEEGLLDLDARLSRFFPGFSGSGKDGVTIRQVLAHAAGLVGWAPLYAERSGKSACLERIVALNLAYPPGTRSQYSDLGFILLGDVLERLGGAPLDVLACRRVLEPVGMHETLYRPPAALRSRIAPTEPDPWRGRLLQGEVHDENAFALGGVAAHSGLFGTAADLACFAQMMLDGGERGGRRIVSRSSIELFTRRDAVPGTTRALGWDTAADDSGRRSSLPGAPGYSSAGSLLSDRSFGHTGFTGTSLWIDPERGLYLILLSNRVHPRPQDPERGARGRDNNAIRAVRSRLADAVVQALARA